MFKKKTCNLNYAKMMILQMKWKTGQSWNEPRLGLEGPGIGKSQAR